MAVQTNDPNLIFPSTLRTVYKQFQDKAEYGDARHGSLLQQDGLNFLGVDISVRNDFDVSGFRRAIAALIHLDHFRTVQVVGDSGVGFTNAGYRRAKEVMCSMLINDRGIVRDDTMLEYGYTASEHDTNWIVNDILTVTPGLRARTIGNVVYMSSIAVERWKCEATTNVHNFVLAYDREGETAFGSDMWLSDSIMSSATGDVLICLEGGPQAFTQAVNVVLQGAIVIVVTGPGMRVESAKGRFSAAGMLISMYEALQNCANKKSVTSAEKMFIHSQAMEYLDRHEDCRPPTYQSRYDLIQKALGKIMTGLESLDVLQVEHVS